MQRLEPSFRYHGLPCSIVAVGCACDKFYDVIVFSRTLDFKDGGYLTLANANKFVRQFLPVKKRTDFKRGERPLLCDLSHDIRACVCVYGHFIYLDYGTYWSFFNNDVDEVVAMWELYDQEKVN